MSVYGNTAYTGTTATITITGSQTGATFQSAADVFNRAWERTADAFSRAAQRIADAIGSMFGRDEIHESIRDFDRALQRADAIATARRLGIAPLPVRTLSPSVGHRDGKPANARSGLSPRRNAKARRWRRHACHRFAAAEEL